MAKIIIVEDDKELGSLTKSYLEKFSHEAFLYEDPVVALESLDKKFDLMILDVMLPNIDGFQVLKRLRKSSSMPVIMLTARGTTSDKIVGLELGADDYLPKPFEPRELLARIDALLRRVAGNSGVDTLEEFSLGDLRLDYRRMEAQLGNEKLDLTTAEFELLKVFTTNRGKVMSRDDIMNELQGIDANVFSRSIDINVSRLRNKLKDTSKEPKYIKTIWGQGYMFL